MVTFTIWAALYDSRAVNRGKDGVDHSYRSAQGQVNYLWNLAVEQYGSGVSVRVNSTSMQNITASGVWSPDSV
ncbi:hypothetical protein N7X57_07125 [Lactiplantibacillus paraplantarum]|uniref:hypothetical protein n=1 Tax=Lactiplantibacillus paraplantarum TaxID=60520 RepID=UPI00068E7758|nr:hypothetical protein [Lactiplantibacillus paraplantarum]ALO04115.1 hypothetical protein ASU28_06990 [Lactiplantibacillus paraplantarum]MCW1910216.1 hypothetical protein [Lactiplantibacillus paraplantarum]OAX74553.1 hypothetical protein A0U96_01165 [Lactiplantibacillus plantarum]RDG12829.1 hypothetical protein DQM08_04040 [Lactiplantibacillus paraplantarum]